MFSSSYHTGVICQSAIILPLAQTPPIGVLKVKLPLS